MGAESEEGEEEDDVVEVGSQWVSAAEMERRQTVTAKKGDEELPDTLPTLLRPDSVVSEISVASVDVGGLSADDEEEEEDEQETAPAVPSLSSETLAKTLLSSFSDLHQRQRRAARQLLSSTSLPTPHPPAGQGGSYGVGELGRLRCRFLLLLLLVLLVDVGVAVVLAVLRACAAGLLIRAVLLSPGRSSFLRLPPQRFHGLLIVVCCAWRPVVVLRLPVPEHGAAAVVVVAVPTAGVVWRGGAVGSLCRSSVAVHVADVRVALAAVR